MGNTREAESRPWEMAIWKPARGKESVLLYLVTIHVMAIIGLLLYPIPDIRVFVTALAFNLLGSLGTTVCNHRYLAHRTLKLNKVVEHFLVF
jgi:fatty-acid desaturase